MAKNLKKVTVNLPADLLNESLHLTGHGITETLVEGLEELKRSFRRSALRQLKGKIHFDLDLNRTRR